MGIRGAHVLTHSISGVSVGELFQIALARKKKYLESINDNGNKIIIPTIDIDASWIYRSSTMIIDNRISYMVNLACEFAKIGFNVVYVCDGSVRHHSKIATIDRISKVKKLMFEGYLKRSELMILGEKRKDCKSIDEMNIIIQQETKLSNRIKSIEKQQQSTNVDVGDVFFTL